MDEHNLDNVAPSSTALDRYESEQTNAISVRSIDDIKRLSLIFVNSGMFKGDRNLDPETKMYQAGVKIIAGVEFGIQPFAAMRGINIINGNAEMSANLMAAKVKKHPKYDYRVTQWDNNGCIIQFFELPRPDAPRTDWDLLGESSFNADDARTAGLDRNDNWRKFARNMFFARAMSNGVRIYTPDVFYGAPVYVDGEISGNFEEDSKPARTEPSEAEIVDAAAPEIDSMAALPPASTGGTREQVATTDGHTTAEEVMDIMTEPDPKDHRRLDPKKTQKIYSLGRKLKLPMSQLEARVAQLENNKEADEAIAILEEDLAKAEATS